MIGYCSRNGEFRSGSELGIDDVDNRATMVSWRRPPGTPQQVATEPLFLKADINRAFGRKQTFYAAETGGIRSTQLLTRTTLSHSHRSAKSQRFLTAG
jgi:hypothetical protein